METKMYIAVLDEVPDHMVPVLVAHAVLRHAYVVPDCPLYSTWFWDSFRKVVVRVNKKEFLKLNDLTFVSFSAENKTLGGLASCAVTVVDSDHIPNVLKFAKLWKPNYERMD